MWPKALPPVYQGTFLRGNEVPMTLCGLCKSLNVPALMNQYLDEKHKRIHQLSYSALSISALNGCEFCALVIEAVREVYSIKKKFSVDQAHEALYARSQMEGPECFVFGNNYGDSLHPTHAFSRKERTAVDAIVFSVPSDHYEEPRAVFTLRIIPGSLIFPPFSPRAVLINDV
jgi:hypothetical protein